jgi:hypothetical protein
MKPEVMKQKIESLLEQVENMEFLEKIQEQVMEQLSLERKASIYTESLKRMGAIGRTKTKKH